MGKHKIKQKRQMRRKAIANPEAHLGITHIASLHTRTATQHQLRERNYKFWTAHSLITKKRRRRDKH